MSEEVKTASQPNFAGMAKLTVVTLDTEQGQNPTYCNCAYTENALYILEFHNLPQNVTALTKALEELEALSNKVNAHLIIEDPSGVYNKHGEPKRLIGRDYTGKPTLITAFEMYINLNKRSAVVLRPEDATQAQIKNNLYNIKHNDNGNISYEIDWSKLRSKARLVLLAVHGAFCLTPASPTYFNRMMNALNDLAGGDSSGIKGLDSKPYGVGGRIYEL